MHIWTAIAAGGTSHRLNPGDATVRSRSRNEGIVLRLGWGVEPAAFSDFRKMNGKRVSPSQMAVAQGMLQLGYGGPGPRRSGCDDRQGRQSPLSPPHPPAYRMRAVRRPRLVTSS